MSKSESKLVKCELCPAFCELGDYQVGACSVRINRDGKLFSTVYGRPCAVHVDPIEKKPFFHLIPKSTAFSIATAGCTLSCKFCQNWEISQARPEKSQSYDMPPEKLVELAVERKCRTIAYTYTEPTVFYEYMYDTAKLARERGLINTMHTCGYINPKPMLEVAKYIDAANVDLKSMDEDFYVDVCGGKLKPVLETLKLMRSEGLWLEITNLVVPTLNDTEDNFKRLAAWVAENLGPDTPVHFSRFLPHYKLKNLPPTPPLTLKLARDTAMAEGIKYAYVGNLRGAPGENTFCPSCGQMIIRRQGYNVGRMMVRDGKCVYCGYKIAGVWE
jgi:pyruvate formate lyase activating enzyme